MYDQSRELRLKYMFKIQITFFFAWQFWKLAPFFAGPFLKLPPLTSHPEVCPSHFSVHFRILHPPIVRSTSETKFATHPFSGPPLQISSTPMPLYNLKYSSLDYRHLYNIFIYSPQAV